MLLAVALLFVAGTAIAQSEGPAIPENAHEKSYGDEWECDIGFRREGDICTLIVVPENAYATGRTYGAGWECLHGYRTIDKTTCFAIDVPAGGFLDPSGERWNCSRGFLKIGDTCQEVFLPENSYLADKSYGPAWTCDRGFEAIGELCSPIDVPLNGYLNSSSFGRRWTCERGYFERNDLCEKVVIPENAYFYDATYGKGWKCERGYTVSGNGCIAVDVPANAHIDRSGNRWECNKNFQKSKGECVLNN